MIGTITRVIRGEGLASAARRAAERLGAASHHALLRASAAVAGPIKHRIVNVAASGVALRLGGVPTQLAARLRSERTERNVALLQPGSLDLSAPLRHIRAVRSFHPTSELFSLDFEQAVREALTIAGGTTIHLEGMSGVPIGSVLRLIDSGLDVIVSLHDFSLFCARPHLLEQPVGHFCDYSRDLDRCHRCLQQSWNWPRQMQGERRALGRQLLGAVRGAIFPSSFLLEQHRKLFERPDLAAHVIEPGIVSHPIPRNTRATRSVVAYAGSVQRHKGAYLLPAIMQALDGRDLEWHIFGGGDAELLRALRHLPNVHVHGYYRGGSLPTLLARHGVGLVVLPSIVPESYSLTLSESWHAGLPVAAFDLGAIGERIHQHDGGWLAPLASQASGIAALVEHWLQGSTIAIPTTVALAADAARAHVALYRTWGVL